MLWKFRDDISNGSGVTALTERKKHRQTVTNTHYWKQYHPDWLATLCTITHPLRWRELDKLRHLTDQEVITSAVDGNFRRDAAISGSCVVLFSRRGKLLIGLSVIGWDGLPGELSRPRGWVCVSGRQWSSNPVNRFADCNQLYLVESGQALASCIWWRMVQWWTAQWWYDSLPTSLKIVMHAIKNAGPSLENTAIHVWSLCIAVAIVVVVLVVTLSHGY